MVRVNKILMVRNDRFGEFLLNIPALRAVKQKYKEASLTLVTDPYVRELARAVDCVDEVISWKCKKHKLIEIIKFSWKLRRSKFDLCVILNPSREFNLVSFLAGIPQRIGYSRKWGFLLTQRIEDEKYKAKKHEIEYNLELVGLIGAHTNDKSLSLNIDESLIDGVSGKIGGNKVNLIAIHPFTSDPLKQWPLENFVQLAKKLIDESNARVMIVGGREEAVRGEIFLSLGSNLINLTGKTSLIQLAAGLKKCQLLISGDSGPMHLAASTGVPVVAIFRSDILAKSAKRWGPWGDKHKVIEKNRLSDIGVDEVFAQAMSCVRSETPRS